MMANQYHDTEIQSTDYQLQVGRMGENWTTYLVSDNPDLLDKVFRNDDEGGLSYDGKSNGKNDFRVIAPDGKVIHEWRSLPYYGEPYIDIYAANPLAEIAETYEFTVNEMRRMCQQYLDSATDDNSVS
jgi:hypothetical protein